MAGIFLWHKTSNHRANKTQRNTVCYSSFGDLARTFEWTKHALWIIKDISKMKTVFFIHYNVVTICKQKKLKVTRSCLYFAFPREVQTKAGLWVRPEKSFFLCVKSPSLLFSIFFRRIYLFSYIYFFLSVLFSVHFRHLLI